MEEVTCAAGTGKLQDSCHFAIQKNATSAGLSDSRHRSRAANNSVAAGGSKWASPATAKSPGGEKSGRYPLTPLGSSSDKWCLPPAHPLMTTNKHTYVVHSGLMDCMLVAVQAVVFAPSLAGWVPANVFF